MAGLTPLPGLLTLVPQDMRPAAARPAGEEPGRAGGESCDVGGPASRGTASPSPWVETSTPSP